MAHCQGEHACHRAAPIGIRAALRIMGTGEATAGQLERRLRCSRCGGRNVGLVVHSDPRPAWVRERDGPAPQTRAELPARADAARQQGLGGIVAGPAKAR